MQTYTFKTYALLLFLSLCLLSACATSKKAAFSPVGTWDYTVQGTPNGNISGKMTISQAGEAYTGSIQSHMGTASLEDLTIEGRNMTSNLTVNGNDVALEGAFEQDTFSGKVKVGYDSYPITATRAE